MPYWKVRECISEQFGDNGYIKFERGKNVCRMDELQSIYVRIKEESIYKYSRN